MLARFEIDRKDGAIVLELDGCRIERQRHGEAPVIEAGIGQLYRGAGSDRIVIRAATRALQPTHFEYVGKVRLETQFHRDRNGLVGKAADEDAFMAPAAREVLRAADMDGIMR